jgi:hypothetical protein
MVAKCANPSCSKLFRYLRGGKLFLVETPPYFITSAALPRLQDEEFKTRVPRSDYFWLCEKCAKSMTITPDQYGRVVIAYHDLNRIHPVVAIIG